MVEENLQPMYRKKYESHKVIGAMCGFSRNCPLKIEEWYATFSSYHFSDTAITTDSTK